MRFFFTTPLVTKRSSRQKIINYIKYLTNTNSEIILMCISRTLHPTSTEFTFFSSDCGILTKLSICWIVNKYDYISMNKKHIGYFSD